MNIIVVKFEFKVRKSSKKFKI